MKAAGLKLGLVCNLATPYKRLIADHELERVVDVTVYSCDVGFQKPDPEIFAIALDQIEDDAARVLMVGDDEINDYAKPRSLGISARLVTSAADDGGTSVKDVLSRLLDAACGCRTSRSTPGARHRASA